MLGDGLRGPRFGRVLPADNGRAAVRSRHRYLWREPTGGLTSRPDFDRPGQRGAETGRVGTVYNYDDAIKEAELI